MTFKLESTSPKFLPELNSVVSIEGVKYEVYTECAWVIRGNNASIRVNIRRL